MGERIGGVLTLTIDGVQYPVRGSLKVSPSSVKRDGVAGQDAVHGYTETPVVPGIEGEISTKNVVSLKDLEAITNSTVQADLANGRSYVLQQAWTEAAFEIDSAEGKFGLKLQGITCDEV